MDKLAAMQTLVTVVERGSFAAAASQLGISAVMVGKQIQQLERHLATALIRRTTRRQALTDAGQQYYEQCRQILALVNESEAQLDSRQSRPRGRLRISAPVTLGHTVLAPIVAAFLAKHDDVAVELMLDNRVVDLIADGFDLAVRIGVLPDQTLIARPLPPYRIVWAASPGYLDRHGSPRHPDELPHHRLLSHLAGSGATRPAHSPFASNEGLALRQAALHGAGIVQQPEQLLASDLASGALLPVLTGHWPAPRPVHLVYLPQRHPRPLVKLMVEHVLEAWPPQP
ncbi:LysR substrate-binding domain-containing protein [Chitinibacteraceae bacterium HSL-7]